MTATGPDSLGLAAVWRRCIGLVTGCSSFPKRLRQKSVGSPPDFPKPPHSRTCHAPAHRPFAVRAEACCRQVGTRPLWRNSSYPHSLGIRLVSGRGHRPSPGHCGARHGTSEEPPWPGLKDLPDDAFQTFILPKDLERACNVGEGFLQSRFNAVGIATMGGCVCLGL